jgi:hypothetical protein
VFGANASPYQQPGEWQVSLSSRNLVSNHHYNGTVEQTQRQELQNYVNNRQNLADLTLAYVLTPRITLSLGIPYVNSSWASRDPAHPLPEARQEIAQNGRGLGDVSISGRYWVFEPDTHPLWNVALGTGLKFPTGNDAAQDLFPGRTDPTNQLRYVDQSVQPGDGGWGIMLEAHTFRALGRVFLFGSGSYLVNPRDENDTPSIIAVLGIPTTGRYEGLGVNSVPDQYLARIGASVGLWKGFSSSLAWRMEGLKRYDLFGDSNGWRRPGTAMFIEPGISYSHGPHSFSFNVPIGYYYNRRPNPYTGNDGDATFPKQVFLSSYSFRFGRQAPPASTPPPVLPPAAAPDRGGNAVEASPATSADADAASPDLHWRPSAPVFVCTPTTLQP